MRIATYNVEWFANLFDAQGRMLADDGWSARHNVTRADQLEALGIVFTALDADAVLIVEAPDTNRRRSTVAMLEAFAAQFELRCRAAVIGFANGTQQELALMYDPDRVSARHDPMGEAGAPEAAFAAPRFDGSYRIDLDIDAAPETVRFSKPPLEMALRTAAGTELRLIGVHVKSKAPHGASTPEQVMRLAIQNRRKQLAECIWLRQRVVEHLTACENLIVLGDFNDGPGLDEYEKLFGRSGVEIVLGEDAPADLRLHDPHARLRRAHATAAAPASARFYLDAEGQYFSAMLDFVMISPSLLPRHPKWRIWHPFDDPALYKVSELREALLTASDHYPVTLDIEV